MVETSRRELIANLPVKLLMQWFGRCAIQPNHFKSHYRMAAPLFDDALVDDGFHFVGLPVEKVTLLINGYSSQALSKVVWPFRCNWTVDTLPHCQNLFFQRATPISVMHYL